MSIILNEIDNLICEVLKSKQGIMGNISGFAKRAGWSKSARTGGLVGGAIGSLGVTPIIGALAGGVGKAIKEKRAGGSMKEGFKAGAKTGAKVGAVVGSGAGAAIGAGIGAGINKLINKRKN